MKKPVINEREINQRMIKLMKENAEQQQVVGNNNNNGGGAVSPSSSDVSGDQERFRQNIAADAKFTEFSILPDAGNVIFKGSIPGVCEWKFELTNMNGVEISMQQPVTITEKILTIFQKMNGEFENWRVQWGPKLTEYQSNGN